MHQTPVPVRNREAGVAMISAILILALISALLVGFVSMVNTDQAAHGINRDQTQAYAAAHAGVEKLTADLGLLFQANFAPTGAQVQALAADARKPPIDGITYESPDGGTGYRIGFVDNVPVGGDGMPDTENPNGSVISSGPYQGLTGLITPYNVEVTARTDGGAEVRMRREMQTVAIPVFQFGIFSENDLSFFAGPDFAFGGRVHTNQHLYLKQDNDRTLTLQDRVTAVGEVIRTHLANGVTGSHNGTVRMARASGCPAAPTAANANCRNLAATEGSKVTDLASANNEPAWTGLSMGTYNGWIRNGRTGARLLQLPLVSNGARTVDLIRRPPAGEVATSDVGRQRFYNMATLRIVMSDTRAELTSLPGIVVTPNVSPLPLQGNFTVTAAERAANANILNAGAYPFSASPAMGGAAEVTAALNNGYRTTAGTSAIGGFIVINRQDRNGNWTDVTKEVMNYGFSGRRISDGSAVVNHNWIPNYANDCVNPHRNAIIRLQRVRDTMPGAAPSCGVAQQAPGAIASDFWPNVLYDPREGALRDDNAGRPVAPINAPTYGYDRLYWAGVMHYAELDVNNLRRWLRGDIGGSNSAACINGAGPATCPMDVTGFVVYFSDRRTNKGTGPNGVVSNVPTVTAVVGGVEVTYGDDTETGELGFEDVINTNGFSTPNGVLDHAYVDAAGNNRTSEDLNWEPPSVLAANAPGRGTLEVYGGTARLLPDAGAGAPPFAANQMLRVPDAVAPAGQLTPQGIANGAYVGGNYRLVGNAAGGFGVPIDRATARVNRAFFFRRALKLVNGGRGELPANGPQGLTVAAENPVYIEGNYNACTNQIDQLTNAGSGVPRQNLANNTFERACDDGGVGFGAHVSAAVIADAVTLLSNQWNDISSFINPHRVGIAVTAPLNADDNDTRQAATTWFRLGIISGKGLNFPRANVDPQGYDHQDFGTDGGAHNFLRYIETWGNETLNYRGSILSFYTARQAVGTFKCCDVVYGAPTRGYNFDSEFLNPSLLPPRTPMFRDLNTLTFRQVLRPTQ
jgi:hypothetical protein